MRKRRKSDDILNRKRQKRSLKESRRAKTVRREHLAERLRALMEARREMLEEFRKQMVEQWEKQYK